MENKKFLDAEGVKVLWSQLSMEDYPNNKTLAAVINAIDQTKADKADIITPVQSNWDVDDENDLAYIKNKPEEITSEEIDRICGMTMPQAT